MECISEPQESKKKGIDKSSCIIPYFFFPLFKQQKDTSKMMG